MQLTRALALLAAASALAPSTRRLAAAPRVRMAAEGRVTARRFAVERVDRLSDYLPNLRAHASPLAPPWPAELDDDGFFVREGEAVVGRATLDGRDGDDDGVAPAYALAGPRRALALDPATTTAAVVTCGGICPGLNTVVRELVLALPSHDGAGEGRFDVGLIRRQRRLRASLKVGAAEVQVA